MKRGNASAIALLISFAPAAHAQIALESVGGVDLTFEGLIQADGDWYDSDVADLDGDAGDGNDADHDLRTAQAYLKGKGRVDWVLGYDAKADKWLDVNARYKFGSGEQFVQAGQFKQPNGLEALSAAKHNDFMSQASVTNTFALGRRLGVAYSYGHPYDRTSGAEEGSYAPHGNWGVTVGYFGRELTRDLGHGSGLGARATWALFNAENRIFHVGLSYVTHDTQADTIRIRARPYADLTPVRLVDTLNLADSDSVSTVGLESFWVHGPFKLQTEYMSSQVQRYGTGSEDFTGAGGYLSAVWNVTGQGWGYKGGEPALQVDNANSFGMWQLALRYDTMDLDDNAVDGGRMDSWTAGVNWYGYSHFKAALNYVAVSSERADVHDDPDIIELRLQLHW